MTFSSKWEQCSENKIPIGELSTNFYKLPSSVEFYPGEEITYRRDVRGLGDLLSRDSSTPQSRAMKRDAYKGVNDE